MSDTHQWDVEITLPQNVIGQIHSSTIFYTGPFPPDTDQIVAYLVVENTGDTDGSINFKLFEYPNTGNENLLAQGNTNCNAGGSSIIGDLQALMPSAISTYPVGIKVWGETETEPIWGMTGTYMWG